MSSTSPISTISTISKKSAKPMTALMKFKQRINDENELFRISQQRGIARAEAERYELDQKRGGLDKEEDSDSDDGDSPSEQQRKRVVHGSAHRG